VVIAFEAGPLARYQLRVTIQNRAIWPCHRLKGYLYVRLTGAEPLDGQVGVVEERSLAFPRSDTFYQQRGTFRFCPGSETIQASVPPAVEVALFLLAIGLRHLLQCLHSIRS